MKYLQKTLSALLALLMFLQLGFADVVTVSAEEADVQVTTGMKYSAESDATDEELFGGYALQMFYGGNLSFFGSAAGENLTGDEKVLYDALVPIIRQIANGERASATIAVGQTVTAGGVTYVADVEAEFSGTTVTDSMINRVLDALLADLPYEMYWHDKVIGCSMYRISGSTLVQVGFRFTVAANYRGADAYTADTAKTGAAKAAAANAQAVIDQYATATDYEKLVGYRDAICSRVEYDYAAAAGDYFTTDIDPWQLISVFDGDSSTNVVCEGYSKAFMYLCDMTAFSGDVACYTVDGYMDGGAHMWNVVEIEDKHYLADVTNSDSGTVGMDGSLFLAGGTGSAAGGYTVAGESYVYSSDTQSLWGTGENSILTLEATGYAPEEENENIIASGSCGDGLIWTLDDEGTFTVSGTGDMIDCYREENNSFVWPWGALKDKITNVVVEPGVTSIGSGAFYDFTNIQSVSLPTGIISIDDYAFAYCEALTEVHIPEGVTYIGKEAFYNDFSITVLDIPDSVTFIGDYAFMGCTGVTAMNIPDGLTQIGSYTFACCSALTSATIPEGVTGIGEYAFWGCEQMASVSIPEGITSIGSNAFRACISLTTVQLPDSLEKIEDEVFAVCQGLIDVDLGNGITSIGYHAFYVCEDLTSVTIPESVTYIADQPFEACYSLQSIVFQGNAPECGNNVCPYGVTVYYPENNGTWTDAVKQQYGESVIWVPNSVGCKHIPVTDQAVTPTCTVPGKTEGSHCETCGAVIVAQEEIPATGHNWSAATCTKAKTCSVCKVTEGKATGHIYDNNVDGTCNVCSVKRETVEDRQVHHMFRMYNPNTGEHFYTGSEEERDNLIEAGWHYEGIAFTFPKNTGAPVYRLFQPSTGEHLYTMDVAEKDRLMAEGWNYENIAFNSAYDTEAVQHRLHNPNADVGAYHFTFSDEEKQNLIDAGWEYQGIGWYSCWK